MYEDQIAIIGAACRLPGAQNLSEFWTLLSSGRDAVTEIPDNRWTKDFYFHPNPAERGKAYTWAAGVIDKVGEFDAGYFGISPREADQIDPQQRLLLELTTEALEDAGIPAARMAGSKCGVYVGASSGDYGDIRMGDPASGDAYFMTGVTASIIANRVSYVFDLHGPSFAVDTACSSSLVALDLACKAIREGRVPTALVGGVSLLLSPYPFIGFCRASMLSPAGRCFAFDARASGYVRAEGGGMILLKPLARALADGDNIRGVILGTGVNSDGRTVGLSLPNGAAQSALLSSIYSENGIDPERLSFVEAHGTGTQAGDPIELGALGEALAQRRDNPLPVGSVKTNIGHLEAGSGMAGLLKAMLALEKRVIPPSLHFETPNPAIAFDELNLSVVTKPTVLPEGEQLLAGVNSFGFGGTNGHAILASPPQAAKHAKATGTDLPPLLISARSEAALKALAAEWSVLLADGTDESNARAVRAAARHRDQHKQRLVVSGATGFDMAEKLDAFTATGHAAGIVNGAALPHGKLVFVFSGNGVQKPGMARDAMQYSATFRRTIAELDTYLEPLLGWSVAARLTEDDDPTLMARTDIAQPLLFTVQVGVVAALRELGVEPAAYAGHSVGEIAAGWAAGALTLADACKIIVVRSQQQQRTEGAGGMAALGLPAEKAVEVLAKIGGGLEIAAINSSQGVTVAGPKQGLSRLETMAAAEEWRFTRLNLNYAFHSAALDPIKDDLIAALKGIAPRDCGERFISTVTGAPADGRTLDADYWWRNIRDPVQFKPAVDHLVADGARIFVEIGPQPALMSYLRDGLKVAEATGRTFGSLTHAGGARDPFPLIAGECHVSGYDLSSSPIYDGPADFRGLPAYPWQREEYWFQPTNDGFLLHTPRRDHALLGFQRSTPNPIWSNVLSTEKQLWLLDHVVEGVPVVPGAALVEIALAAAKITYPDAQCLEVTGVEIPRALVVEPGHSRELRVVLEEDGQLRIASRSRLSEEPWSLHAVARVAQGSSHVPAVIGERPIAKTVDAKALYATASRLGLDYGPYFQTVQRVEIIDENEAVVALTPTDEAGTGEYLINPALLDGALQGLFALLANRVEIGAGESFMPARFGRIRLFAPYHRPLASARIAIRRAGVRSVAAALVLFDANGDRVADIDDCWFQRVKLNRQADLASQLFRFEPIAVPSLADNASPAIDMAAALAIAALPAADIRDGGEVTLLFDAFLASSAYEAVKSIVTGNSPFRIADLVLSGVVAREAAPLMGWLMLLLARHGLATEGDEGWTLPAEAELPEPAVLWRTLIADAPELTAELALAGGADLPRMLRTGFEGVKLSAPLVDQMLYGSPPGEQTLAALSDAVMAVAADWPVGRPLRILEIGAGSGALTRRLLNRLTHWRGTLKYVASDRDAHMTQRLALIASDYVGTSARQWNPAEGGFSGDGYAGPFDLVVSMYGLTRAEMHGGATQRLNTILAPGGYLLTAEPEQNEIWNAVFGQSAEWWAGSLDSDFPMSPISGGATLRDQLIQSGLSPLPATSVGKGLWPVTLIAARRDPAAGNDVSPEIQVGRSVVLIASGNCPVAPMLAERLTAMGIAVSVIDPPEVADGAELLAALSAPGEQPPQVVCLAPSHDEALSASAAASRMVDVLTVARLTAETDEHTTLCIVTIDAHGEDRSDPAEAGLWGFGRTIRNELSQLDCRLIDLPARWSAREMADTLAMEIALPDAEREIVWSAAGRHALRLRRGFPPAEAVAEASALTIGHPGLIDTLHWIAAEKRQPGPGQVRIAVKASGLNFRDVMWAMALLPEEALMDGFSGPTLGLECTGIIDALGESVAGFAIGDRVMALAPAALQSHVVTEAHAVAPLPDSMGFAAGASIPVTYLTVLYSLSTQARLEAGEWILIHGGAGGVGLAAIQYAKHVGATIVATAGSPTKRAFLKHLGVDHVFDSRDLAFADAVRELTGGHGVDVVLNSLGGEAMERSLGLLKPFGRFVELGKRDFMMDTRVGLRALRQNVSYYAVDVDRLPVERPALAAKLLKDVSDLMAAGSLHPLPYRTFPFSEVSDAFRLMQGAGHLGKIVLVPDGSPIPLPLAPADIVGAEGVYLITGGLSGFGLETARWLAAKGARQIALVGRRRASEAPEVGDALKAFAAQGVDTRTFQCDVGDAAAVEAMLADIRTNFGSIRGVVHAAMVVDDGLVGNLTTERIAGVLAPKVDGARHLDLLTRNDPIDLFVLYSSATTVMGAPGQGSYVAANMGLEAIARERKAEGLPALAVAWGPIGDVGYLARHDAANDALMRRLGTTPIPATVALDALPLLIASGQATIAFAPVRWDAAHQYLPILKTPTFEDVASGSGEAGGGDLRDRIHAMSPLEAKEFITGLLIEEAARVMSFAPDRIDAQRPLSEFGMDSLMAVELRLALETRLGIDVPLVSLSDTTTLSTIAARIVRNLSREDASDGGLIDTMIRHEADAAHDTLDKANRSFGAHPEHAAAAE